MISVPFKNMSGQPIHSEPSPNNNLFAHNDMCQQFGLGWAELDGSSFGLAWAHSCGCCQMPAWLECWGD